MIGYFYDPLKKKLDYGESEKAFPTIAAAMAYKGEPMVEGFNSPIPEGVVESGQTSQADFNEMRGNKPEGMEAEGMGALAKGLDTEGNIGQKAGSGLMQYGMATANPALIGAGLVSKVIGGNIQRKRQQVLDEYKQRLKGLQKMSDVGRSIG